MKKIRIILLVLVVVIAVVLLAKDVIIKTSIEKSVKLVTGLKLNIGSLHVGILKPVADIKNLQLFNPLDFTDRTMVDLPEIYVNYDLPAIIGGTIHLPELRLALKEFVVIKNAQGKLNLDALKSVQTKKEDKQVPKETSGKAPNIKIDVLKLSIGKVIYKDYSKGATPEVKEFNINLNESYTNINDPQTLVRLIVTKALMNTSIVSLTNFDLKGLEGSLGGVLEGAQETVSKNIAATQEKAKDTVTQAQEKLNDVLKNPLGSD